MDSDSALPSPPRPASIPFPIKLLVVEDNLTNQKLLLRQLQSLGYEADLASNGQAALEMTAQTFYHLILMDCRLPGVDGYTATRLIRQRDAGAPQSTIIIALTASDEPQAQIDALAAGMDDFLTKPLRRELLAARLEHWIKRCALLQSEPGATTFYATLRELQFDLEQLQQLSDHSLEFEQELLQLYLDDLQVQFTQLQQAISTATWPQIEQIAHHIKGASANIGAIKLSQLAEVLEQQSRQQSGQQSGQQFDSVHDLLNLLDPLVHEFEWLHQRITPVLLNQVANRQGV